jgi:hypothetical protein
MRRRYTCHSLSWPPQNDGLRGPTISSSMGSGKHWASAAVTSSAEMTGRPAAADCAIDTELEDGGRSFAQEGDESTCYRLLLCLPPLISGERCKPVCYR